MLNKKSSKASSAKRTAGSLKRVVRMPGPAMSTVRSHLRRLRKLIDESKDPHEQRIGYAMECAIRWAREDTVGWGRMDNEAKLLAGMLRRETGQS